MSILVNESNKNILLYIALLIGLVLSLATLLIVLDKPMPSVFEHTAIALVGFLLGVPVPNSSISKDKI